MKFLAPALAVSVSILGYAVITSWDDLSRPDNVISLEGGNIKLGEVYYETVGQSIRVEDAEDGSVVATIETQNFDLASRLEEQMLADIDVYNEDRAPDDLGTLESLSYTVPLTVEYRGWVSYQSENHSNFDLTVRSETLDLAPNELTFRAIVDRVGSWQDDARPQIESAFLLSQQ